MQTLRSRRADVGRERALRLYGDFGRELRIARVTAGLSQSAVAHRAGLSQATVSYAERAARHYSLDVLARLAASAGHELALRVFPAAGVSLRDSGQLAIADAIQRHAHPGWTVSLERPVGRGADRRAADMLLAHPDEWLHIEIERRLVDLKPNCGPRSSSVTC